MRAAANMSCSQIFRIQWRSITRTTHRSSPSPALSAPLRCLIGAISPWRKPSTWDTREPFWRAPSHATITSVSQTAASHLSSPSRFKALHLFGTSLCFDHTLITLLFHPQTILPASAQDVYYRDEIGNISTSHLQVLDDSVEVEVRPRFPLFGGWKTHYMIGYNLPSYEYLYTLGEMLLE